MAVVRLGLIQGSHSSYSGVTYLRPCVRIPVCFKQVCKCGTDAPGDLAHARTNTNHCRHDHRLPYPTATGTPTHVCHRKSTSICTCTATYHTQEITFKSMRQLVGIFWPTHTLSVFHTHSHEHTPPINPLSHFPLLPLRPLTPHGAGGRQADQSLRHPTTHTYTDTHTQTGSLIRSVSFSSLHTPPLNDHRYVKKLPHLKQQPPSAT